eukprot:CAMPEP_0119156002 /NCGR_PEP_ID=MMETSP1310-20130426/52036_1 /TAXON_ID=464262 /ORGANISM="Genus nov. species nov., Strain RCC2339" /LENGTH=105 /DNA_ID=CAMNT_0007148611 /DNA_START=98 /DNA_END=415 /DNA_ORIENTATION=+
MLVMGSRELAQTYVYASHKLEWVYQREGLELLNGLLGYGASAATVDERKSAEDVRDGSNWLRVSTHDNTDTGYLRVKIVDKDNKEYPEHYHYDPLTGRQTAVPSE